MGNESLKVLENSLNFLFLKGYEPCTTFKFLKTKLESYAEPLDYYGQIHCKVSYSVRKLWENVLIM